MRMLRSSTPTAMKLPQANRSPLPLSSGGQEVAQLSFSPAVPVVITLRTLVVVVVV